MTTGLTETETTAEPAWVIRTPMVREAIRRLIGRRTHPFFLGYVHLRQVAARDHGGGLTGIQPSWNELGRVLEVPGAPARKPYLKPFQTSANRDDEFQWWNVNIAGSWSPASLREGQGPLAVVSVNADKTFNLREDHAALALKHLLYDERMSALDFATFMLRDFALYSPSPPGAGDLVTAFRERYMVVDDEEFDSLYVVGSDLNDLDWFEPFGEEEDE